MTLPDQTGGASIELAPGLRIDRDLVQLEFISSSGPGGQNVNRRATKAQLRIPLGALGLAPDARTRLEKIAASKLTAAGDLLITSDQTRSQRQNEKACFARLRELLIRATSPPKKRRPTRTPRWARERRLEQKRLRSEAKRQRKPPDRP